MTESEIQEFIRWEPLMDLLLSPQSGNPQHDPQAIQSVMRTIIRNSGGALNGTYAQLFSILVPPPQDGQGSAEQGAGSGEHTQSLEGEDGGGQGFEGAGVAEESGEESGDS
ncbi:hypothetical protein HDV00_012544 [Rhizophlyctis rosea]|nr:hypothetical protein HDV00_012544 [Rhizophlyctis rosea]